MGNKTTLGVRMKEYYELRTKTKLTRRIPTIIRLDGKSFHTFTKNLVKPFDEGLIEDMQLTTKYLCENIEGVKCGYTQSDEISLLITDYDKLETNAWFDYNIQKMVSVSASMATAIFNQLRSRRYLLSKTEELYKEYNIDLDIVEQKGRKNKSRTIQKFMSEFNTPQLAFFDSRVFQIPEKEEVVNYFLWRQRDAEKNSIAMLAQSLYSTKELHKKNGNDMQEMTFQKGHNWNDLHFSKKRGSFYIKSKFVNDKKMFVYRKDEQWCSRETEDTEIGDLWYQKNIQSTFYPDKNGRLLVWGLPKETNCLNQVPDWCDIKIEKIRNKWELLETPFFNKDRNVILNLL